MEILPSGTRGNYALIPPGMNLFQLNNIETISLLRSFNNDLPNGNVLISIFSIYGLVNKSFTL